MNNLEKKCWAYWLLMLLLVLSISGCGARKVDKFNTKKESENKTLKDTSLVLKEEVKTEKDVTKETNENTKVVENKEATKKTFRPLDSEKPMIFKHSDSTETVYYNTEIVEEKTVEETVTDETKSTKETDQTKTDSKIKKEAKGSASTEDKKSDESSGKHVDQESFFNVTFWIILIVILLLIYLVYKNRKKIPIIKKYFS